MPADVQQQCFGGREVRKFDQVSRLAIPNKFRARYGSKVYLFKNIQTRDSVIVYSEEDFLKVYDNLAKTYSGAQLTMIQRMFVDNVDMAPMDKAGRITVKQDFIDYAGLKEEVLIVCNPDRLELWDEEKWNSQFAAPAELPDLSLLNISPRS